MSDLSPAAETLLKSLPDATAEEVLKPAPVHLWNPPLCGELDMRIARDGTWYHEGRPIRRHRLARLFASILRLEEDGRYVLVTPVERWLIRVEATPFVVVSAEVEGQGDAQRIRLTTNMDERFWLDASHPLQMLPLGDEGALQPVVTVRDGLQALLHRNVYYQLAELSVPMQQAGVERFGLFSCGCFFPMDGAGV